MTAPAGIRQLSEQEARVFAEGQRGQAPGDADTLPAPVLRYWAIGLVQRAKGNIRQAMHHALSQSVYDPAGRAHWLEVYDLMARGVRSPSAEPSNAQSGV